MPTPAAEPVSPISTVSERGIGSGPGTARRARPPITKPDRTAETIVPSTVRLLLVALHDLGRPRLRRVRILAGVATRAPLPEQVPALVERHADLLEAPPLALADGAGRLALPELVLLGDELLDALV